MHIFIAQDCTVVAEPSLDGGEKVSMIALSFDEFIHEVTAPSFNGREFALNVFLAERQGKLEEIHKEIFE